MSAIDDPLATFADSQLLAAIENARDGFSIVDVETLEYVDFNEAGREMLGYSRDELRSMHPYDHMVQSDEAWLRALDEELRAQAPAPMRLEQLVRRKDGSTFPAEIHRQAVQMDGRWLAIATWRDATRRRARQMQAERLAAVMNLSSDSVYVVRRSDMLFLDINDAGCVMLENRRENLLGTRVRKITQGPLSSLDSEAQKREIQDLAAYYDEVIRVAPTVARAERVVPRANGATIDLEMSWQGLQVNGEWLVALMMHDITERHRAQQRIQLQVAELTRSNRELEQFSDVISHDLNEPLRQVANYAQLLERRYGKVLDEDGREFVTYIVGGARRMERLITDLLGYARAGRKPERTMMRLDDALDDALQNLQAAIEESGACIERAALPTLPAERTGMVQVFQNLVGNAIKFRGDRAPHIRVDARETDGAWRITVADNGIGIAPQFHERIFAVFQRLHARDKYEGSGIGLAIGKKIVERHGGALRVESIEGEGTTFTIELPKPSSC